MVKVRGTLLRCWCIIAILISLAACTDSGKVGPGALAGLKPDGTITMEELHVAFIGSGSGGDGTLHYQGKTYPFMVGGLGIGGLGASKVSATGEVYKLDKIADFAGAYAQARYGYALGDSSAGDLWLQNDNGVILHLKAKREGLMLTLGADAVVIAMK